MKLHPVTDGPRMNRWCGPSALSAITGRTTDETSARLRLIMNRRQVTRVECGPFAHALRSFGFFMHPIFQQEDKTLQPTLAAWLRETGPRESGRVFVIIAGNHWQVVSGRRYVDSITREIVSITDPRVKRRAKVACVWEVQEYNR